MELGAAVLLSVLLIASPAGADTLREAIAAAYATNTELAEARARQDAREEAPEQARGDGRPTLTANAGRVTTISGSAKRAVLA